MHAPGERGARRLVPVYVNEDAGEVVVVVGCRGAGGGQSSF